MAWWDSVASIIDKMVPTKKEKVMHDIQELENQLADAVASHDSLLASRVNKRMRQLLNDVANGTYE